MFVNYVMGYLSGWWLGAEDNRATQPWISPERWTKELVAAGFQKPEAIVLDYEVPYHTAAGILASRENRLTKPPSSMVTLLCHAPDGPYVPETRKALEKLGISVDTCQLSQNLPNNDVISLLDLQEPVLHGMTETTFTHVIGSLKSLKKNSMIWATQASQVDCEDPRAAMVLGLSRTARNDLSIKLFTVEVDNATPRSTAGEAVAKILLRTNSRHVDPQHTNPDYEFAVSKGDILVPRLHWQTISDSFARDAEAARGDTDALRKHIDVKTQGLLHTMCWKEAKIQSPGEGEILIEPKAAGLNFRDVMIAMGILNHNPSEMGFEGSGIVREVGAGVRHLAVGDRVVYLGSGCFSTYLTMKAVLAIKIDDSTSFEQAAALPGVYATALMALVDKGNLQRGQSILIHSACGGVGLAAIQISQMIGAEVRRPHLPV
jgi:hypothetical protein